MVSRTLSVMVCSPAVLQGYVAFGALAVKPSSEVQVVVKTAPLVGVVAVEVSDIEFPTYTSPGDAKYDPIPPHW